MEQIEVNKQPSEKSGEVGAATSKSLESCESAILPSQNGSMTSGGEAPSVKTGCGGVKLNGGGAYPYVYALHVFRVRGLKRNLFRLQDVQGKKQLDLRIRRLFIKSYHIKKTAI